MVAGDFDGNGCADLAVGVPRMDLAGTDTGGVRVLYGTTTDGLQVASPNDDLWRVTDTDVGVATNLDRFGWTLAVGRFDDDGYDDLAIGSLVDDEAGAVHVLRGSASGITAASDRVWHRQDGAIPGMHTAGERFGAGLGSGDYDGNGTTDLAVGVPRMDLSSVTCGGALFTVLTESASVPTVREVQTAIQEDMAEDQTSEGLDQLGLSFAPARPVSSTCQPGFPGGFDGG
jgi:hypothetical protein